MPRTQLAALVGEGAVDPKLLEEQRGGHLAGVSPNHIDATLVLYSAKWVLAELVRLTSGIAVQETQRLCDQIAERQLEILWKDGDVTRILRRGMKPADQLLVILYDSSPKSEAELRETIEYRDVNNFKKVLNRLHAKREIEYRPNGLCVLLPPGQNKAEEVIRAYTDGNLQ